MMKKLNFLVLSLCFALCMSSCMVTRVTIGDGPVGKSGKTEVYSKSRRAFILFGLVPLGGAQPVLPTHNDIQIKNSSNVVDALISGITFGIITTRTTKIIVHKTGKE